MEYRPRVVLVYDKHFRIVGSIRQMDMLRALMRRGDEKGKGAASSLTPEDKAAAWRDVLGSLYDVTRSTRVKDVMYRYSEPEYIDEAASLEEAIVRLVEGPYLNLVVTGEGTTNGILRMSDVFSLVCRDTKRAGMR
jgi:CBS-domain-containing membrane protein